MRRRRAAAVLTWINAVAFGIPAVPVAIYVLGHGSLPWLFDWFPLYGGPWSDRLSPGALAGLLVAFFVVCAAARLATAPRQPRPRLGWQLTAVLLPVQAVFWIGFALPLPWICGTASAVLLAMAWRARQRAA